MPRDDDCFDVSNLYLSVVSHYRDWCYAFSSLIDSYAFCNQGAELMESAIGGLRLLTLKTPAEQRYLLFLLERSDLGLEVGGSWSDWKHRKLGNENGRGIGSEYHSLLLHQCHQSPWTVPVSYFGGYRHEHESVSVRSVTDARPQEGKKIKDDFLNTSVQDLGTVLDTAKSMSVKRAWSSPMGTSGKDIAMLFIEDALSNLDAQHEYATNRDNELEIASLQKDGGLSFSRVKIEGMVGSYPFENLRSAIDILFLCGSSDLVVAKQAILLYTLQISGSAQLTAVQLLWVYLIIDTLGALALATEPPNDGLMKRQPVKRTDSFITKTMWRNITGQSPNSTAILNTFIFNTFVFCQVFNEINSCDIDKINIFRGIFSSWIFVGVMISTVVFQAMPAEKRCTILLAIADAPKANEKMILHENEADVATAQDDGYESSLVYQLALKPGKVSSLAKAIRVIAKMEEPIGQVLKRTELSNGFILEKMSSPLGVLLVIFKSRPEALVQVAGGLAGETPHMISAAVKGITPLSYEFTYLVSNAFSVFPSSFLLLQRTNREIIKN
ncbi:unnamed protein product [Lactuca virosa]|uniref:Cation-transporting P-type ATPase C-terminal domain-containing protein n=1 Tax=Lactuca virosa TaxID=75947 RepID=A0AAU9P0X5_9ASTR|nr:unnamed protein product [Lactuca virosa]